MGSHKSEQREEEGEKEKREEGIPSFKDSFSFGEMGFPFPLVGLGRSHSK